MNTHSTLEAAESRFHIDTLTLSPINPRQHVCEQDVIELAESIRAAGLIQNMAGFKPENGGVEIVAGGRRLRALKYLFEQNPDLEQQNPELVYPTVKIAPDLITAQAWAGAENTARRDLHPADEIRAYGKMKLAGATPAVIARAFAVSEKHVYRRLALASLPAAVIDALAANEISLGVAACFTISSDEARTLEVLQMCRGQSAASEYQIKRLLRPDSARDTDRRAIFIGLDAYIAEGGRTGGDLFAEETILDDTDILDRLFAEKLAATAKTYEGAGWKWADAITEPYLPYNYIEDAKFGRLYPEPGTLTEEQAERYDALAELANGDVLDDEGQDELDGLQAIIDGDYTDEQKAHSGIIIHVDQRGELQVSAGLVRKADKAAAIAAGALKTVTHHTNGTESARSPISAKLADDLDRVARGARQNALLSKPDLLLTLLAYQLTGKMGYRRALGLSTTDVPNWPTTEAEGYALDKRLTTPADRPADPFGSDLAKGFRAFRRRGQDHVMVELNRHLASLATIDDGKLGALIDKEAGTAIRQVWTPTAENFFNRVGGPYLNAIWRELLDLAEDHPKAVKFAKLKKGEKAALLESLFADEKERKAYGVSDEQAERIANWLPESMR